MSRNIRLEIEYDGTNYCGWQVQDSGKSIQATIEKALKKILREKVSLIVSGRTDAGVHAEAQVANFKTGSSIPLNKLQLALNTFLPKDIVVSKVKEVPVDFHSRFSAKSKIYRYMVLNRSYSSAFLRNRSHLFSFPLNLRLMRQEAKCLLGRHNFKAFQAADKTERNPFKTIKRIRIDKDGDLIEFQLEADGFLYNMARNIVGTLLEIGRGRFTKGDLIRILRSKDRGLAGPTAPARGLCLVKVKY
ncbi:MAG: tRNA pseudouridine(38-40) synthase TruA [Candidatus Omnitrophica bacterium]|nr:tRNA pseudouridine(38-40) synthase TruA [Candidatus Omnitrophota bacterium]MBU1869418.1 tRNA pseudouridine(38-40) synthase TruA [Candidatus Omnitrophota bacterium]